MASVLWLHGGACSGNTMSFLNADEPNVVDLIVDFGLDIIWHPSLGMELGDNAQKIFRDCASGAREMDIFVFEGTVIEGPNGTGRYNIFADRPMKEWVEELAAAASIVVAIGDCACWGGIPAAEPNPTSSTGLQFHKRSKGGFLGPDFVSKAGLPVINIPGCPAHPDWITQILVALATGRTSDIALDDLHRPQTFFKTFTQTGCTRVQFFEYKQSTLSFGEGTRTGCLFYEFGCRGPMTHSPCNRILWNRQSSKTRRHAVHRVHRTRVPLHGPRPRNGVQDAEGERDHPQGGARGHRSPHLHGPRRGGTRRRAGLVQRRHVRRLSRRSPRA
ncbi:MAG: hypothetical protein R2715_00285 [Ilumatobacteraceae bacterium]